MISGRNAEFIRDIWLSLFIAINGEHRNNIFNFKVKEMDNNVLVTLVIDNNLVVSVSPE